MRAAKQWKRTMHTAENRELRIENRAAPRQSDKENGREGGRGCGSALLLLLTRAADMCNLITNNFGSINHIPYVQLSVCVCVCVFACGIDTNMSVHACACLCMSVPGY